ncbi:hypothetical protein AX774_g3425 [Zancudomyces culisetae]|uniref:Uncharacterized protein n=1 Tax=Zancudomyces culisetae TaxID=1213189 RepID=A0A1R1PQ48_ZANCU|nr:hypothetical protein AX774_g3425 [Zancudomyces culisetae]|eukprot:OMH83087.1 hypothetical protein AX774_g3425 [Zancudomyces culisetae]
MDGLITLLDTAIKKHSIVYPAFESNSNIGGRSPGNPKLNINTPFTCVDISPNGYSLFTGDVYGKVMELDLRYLSLSSSKTQLYSGKRSAYVWQRYSGMGGSVKHLSYCESLNFPPSYSPVAFRSAVTNTENTNSHTYLSAKQPIVSFDPLSNTNLQHPNLDSNPDIIHDTNPSNLSIDQSYHSFNPASRSANFSNIADNSIYNTYSSSIANATINQFTRVSNIRRGIPQSMTDSSDEDNRPLVAPDDPSLISHLPADEPFDSKTSVVDSSNTNLSNRGDTQIVGVVSTIPDSSQDQTQTQTQTETQIETTHNPLMDVLTPQKSTSPSTHTFKSTKSHSSEVSISGTHRSINCPDMSVDLAPDNSDRVNIKSSNKRSISKLLSSSPPSIPKVTEKSERAGSKSQLNIDIPNSSLNPISIPISTSTLHKKPLSPNVKEKVEYFQKKAKAESKLKSNSNSPINIDPSFSSYSIPTFIPNPADKDSFQTATPGNTQYHTTPSRRSRKSSEKFLSLKNSFEPKTVSPSNVETNTESPSLTLTKNTNNSPPSASPSPPPSPSPLKHSSVARASNFISWRSSNTSYTPSSPPHHSLGSAKSNSIISESSAGLAASHDKKLDKNAATFSFINPSSSQNASSSINTKDKYATSTKSRRDVRNLSATDTANEDSSHDSTTAPHIIDKSANGRLRYSASSSKLLNSLISDTLADNFNQTNSNINNMHLDMIRQSFVTESKIDKLTESVSDNQQKLSELTRYINDYLVPDSENPKGVKNINNSNNSTVSHGANVFNKSGHNKNGYANGSLYYAS